jgi:Fe-S-cluster containining protein
MTTAYDCCRCGACCRSPWTGEGHVRLYEPDIERMERLALPIVILTQPGEGDQLEEVPLLTTKRDRDGLRICIAFAGDVGEACGCSIYEDRPFLCREFELGDTLCRQARQKAGLPV